MHLYSQNKNKTYKLSTLLNLTLENSTSPESKIIIANFTCHFIVATYDLKLTNLSNLNIICLNTMEFNITILTLQQRANLVSLTVTVPLL